MCVVRTLDKALNCSDGGTDWKEGRATKQISLDKEQ